MDNESSIGRERQPALREWMLSLFCSIMIASQVRNWGQIGNPYSAITYYFGEPFTWVLQRAMTIADLLILLSIAVSFFSKAWRSISQIFVTLVAIFALVAGWLEIAQASCIMENSRYKLDGLPFAPLGNWGMLGTQVFATYLIFLLPDGRLRKPGSVLVKWGAAVCIFILQWIVWTSLNRP